MRRLTIRPRAARDIDDHAIYLALNASVQTAERFQEMVEKTLSRIEEAPELGSPWESGLAALEGLRFWPVKRFRNHVIFYAASNESIGIVRVLHASQDLEHRLLEIEE